ncbi:LamG-like jellyroll fold domain-containing protein [Micromonospora echinospora]|uniref:pectate lyase family protein n=1 Tax=Micromonospora echinospora TaxID=1877 RepID=UPI0033F13A61
MRTSTPSRRRRITALTAAAMTVPLALVAATLTTTPASAATVFTEDFQSGSLSAWSKSGGDWSITTDGSQVVRQTNTTSGNARFFAGDTTWTAYTVQARVKPITLGANGHASLLARVTGSTKYYRLALLPANQVQLQAVDGSTVTTLASATRTVTTGTWHTLAIDVSGTTIRASVDGTTIGQGTSTLVGTGRIGLQTGYSSAAFDDVTVTTNTTTPPTSQPPTTPPPTTPPPGGVPYSNAPDGFAQGVTGGAGGQTVTVTNQEQLNQYVTAAEPYVIRVAGTINISPKGTELRVSSNKTIIGVGTSGHIVGGGFFLRAGVSNVIIRNLTIRDTLMPDDDPGDDSYDYDAIQIDTAERIWIDHNRLSRMNDGLLDSRKDTTKITVSWNHFDTNNKTFGIGWTDNVTAQMTVHHNWFQNTRTRNPSADNLANIHFYNNYLQNTGSGHFVRGLTKAVVENSYFDSVQDPYYVEAGELVQRGNITVNSSWGSGKVKEKGTAFDPRSFYSYTLHPAADVPALLRTYAGPQASIGN